ncbi:hypothetical protein L208DRAFT_1379396 [Tricholoma matsutake]|nr:hypothetical protein L208DRAFT_1379396 [Tricholoma matsutake 945]
MRANIWNIIDNLNGVETLLVKHCEELPSNDQGLAQNNTLLQPNLEILLQKWQCGKTYWKKLTAAELKELDHERDEQIERGEVETHGPHHCHSDFGTKHAQSNTTTRTKKKHQTSAREVSNTEGSDNENTVASNIASRTKKHQISRREVSDAEESDKEGEAASNTAHRMKKLNRTDNLELAATRVSACNSDDPGSEAPAAQPPSEPVNAPLLPLSA